MAVFVSHANPSSEVTPEEGSRRESMECLLRLGGTWGHEDAVHGRAAYRTFEWRRECVLAGTPAWVLVLGWQDFDEDDPAKDQPPPEDTPWLFMVEVWDTDVTAPDYDAHGSMLEQFQTRNLDLVAYIVRTILDHQDVAE